MLDSGALIFLIYIRPHSISIYYYIKACALVSQWVNVINRLIRWSSLTFKIYSQPFHSYSFLFYKFCVISLFFDYLSSDCYDLLSYCRCRSILCIDSIRYTASFLSENEHHTPSAVAGKLDRSNNPDRRLDFTSLWFWLAYLWEKAFQSA